MANSSPLNETPVHLQQNAAGVWVLAGHLITENAIYCADEDSESAEAFSDLCFLGKHGGRARYLFW